MSVIAGKLLNYVILGTFFVTNSTIHYYKYITTNYLI